MVEDGLRGFLFSSESLFWRDCKQVEEIFREVEKGFFYNMVLNCKIEETGMYLDREALNIYVGWSYSRNHF